MDPGAPDTGILLSRRYGMLSYVLLSRLVTAPQPYWDEIDDELVSLAVVTDPFGGYDEAYLNRCFRDVVIPFKKHYIVDLHFPINEIGSSGHRKHARRALRAVQVQVVEHPTEFVETWSMLYEQFNLAAPN